MTDIVVDADASAAYDAMVHESSATGVTSLRTKDGRLFSLSYQAAEVRVAGLPYYVTVGFASSERACLTWTSRWTVRVFGNSPNWDNLAIAEVVSPSTPPNSARRSWRSA